MSRQRPERVKVGPHWWDIKWGHAAWRDGVATGVIDDSGALGFSHSDLGIIYINTHFGDGDMRMSDSQIKATLLHEILHCCIKVGGCSITNVKRTDIDLEEWVVSTMEPFLFGALLDNPDVFAWISSVE